MVRRRFFNGMKLEVAGHYFRVVIASLLVVSSLLNITFAWLESPDNKLYSSSYVMVSADDLIMETDGIIRDNISMTNVCRELTECTSVDGRNIFFRLSDYTSPYYNMTDEDLIGLDKAECYRYKFREASVNDRNSKYISMEFTLTSDKNTNVWLSNESYILGAASDAVRVSIDYDINKAPRVLEAYNVEGSGTTEAVASITEDGSVSNSEDQQLMSISHYYYTGLEDDNRVVVGEREDNALLTLEAGVSRKITVNVWLEGCDSDCNSDIYGADDLQVRLRFTAGIKKPRVLKFKDYTFESWAYIKLRSNPEEYQMLGNIQDYEMGEQRKVFIRDTATQQLYAMVRDTVTETTKAPDSGENVCYCWTATLPSSVKDIEFVRFDYHDGTANPESDWEFWDAGEVKTIKGAPVLGFYALDGGSRGGTDRNNGIWVNSTDIMTLYLVDNALDQDDDTTIEYSVNFPYYGASSFLFTMKMTPITTASGSRLYAARIVALATARYAFRHIATGVAYTGLSRTNKFNNVYTTQYNATTQKYSGAWSKDHTNYPIR